MATPGVVERTTAGAGRSLVVAAGGERLALPAGNVAEVVRPRRLSRVPHAPQSLLGVASLRGAVVPILSLSRLRGTGDPAGSPTARWIIVAVEPPFGLMVDRVEALGDGADLPRFDAVETVARTFGASRAASVRKGGAELAPVGAPRPERPMKAVLGFTVAGQLFGFDLGDVVEVAPVPAETSAVPEAGAAMVGLATRRGDLLPLASARALLGRPAIAEGTGHVIVVRVAGTEVGLVVDGVEAILRVPEEALEPLPAVLARGSGEARVDAICRLDGGRRLLSLLSAARLFDDDTMRRISAAASTREDPMAGVADAEDAQAERFVVFDLAGEAYALPIGAVDEVVRLPKALTRVPRAPAFVEGVMNLRGAVVPVVDAARRFGASPTPVGTRRRVVVATVQGVQVGFVVDGVSEVLSATPDELMPAPDIADDGAGTFDRVVSIARDDRLILVVSPEALLAKAERDILAGLAAEGAAP